MDNMGPSNLGTSLRRKSEICEDFKYFKTTNKLDLAFSNVTYMVRKHMFLRERKKILQNVSGQFKSGELTAIMGPSGAGKTSLMNILAGYITKDVTGNITVNGKSRDLNSFRRFSSYIMQDDHVHSQLTVLESMKIAAELKIKASSEVKMQRIRFVMKLMGLESAEATVTEDLSGGQRKRLVIAFELISDSPVMFLDEPTSHLDSVTSRQCMEILKSLASRGRTIICTIHQPSVILFNMLDHLYVVAKGRCIYDGRIPNLLPFLDELGFKCPTYHNPSDYMMEIASGEYGDITTKFAEAAKEKYFQNHEIDNLDSSIIGSDSDPANQQITKKGNDDAAGFWKQLTVLLWCNLIKVGRNRDIMLIVILAYVGVATFMGFMYWKIGGEAKRIGDNSKLLVLNVVCIAFCSVSLTLQSFPQELPTLSREYFNNWYKIPPLYVAKKLTYMIITTFCTIGYTLIVYFMTDQPVEMKRFGFILFHSILIALISQNVGIFFAIALNPKISVFVGINSFMPHLVFSGLFIRSRDTVSILSKFFDFSIFKHGFEGMMLATYGYCRKNLRCTELCEYTPKIILKEYDMQKADYAYSTRYLIGYYLVFDVAIYIALKWKLSRRI